MVFFLPAFPCRGFALNCLMLQKWQFTTQYNYKIIKIDAEVIYLTDCIERIKVTTGTHEMILEGNRPLLAAKGLKRKPIFWKIKEGHINNLHAFQLMQKELGKYLRK